MNVRKPKHLTPSKFPGMTREEYDLRLNVVKMLCSSMFRRLRPGPALDANGRPGFTAEMLQAAVKRVGASAFGGIYRAPERPKTGLRESARRLRQQARGA